MAVYKAPLDIKINIVTPEAPLSDVTPGVLPATRDALAEFFNTQLDFFGLALPAYGVILASLCLLAFVVSLSGWAAGSPYRERGRTLTNTIPLVLLLGMSFVLPNLHSADAENIDHAGLTVTTNPQDIVWTVPQGTAATETFTGTTTVFSDANNGYELFVTGDVTGINSPTHDIGFSVVNGGDLSEVTPLGEERVLIKSHALPIADDVTTFDFQVDIPRTLAIGEYTVSLNFSVEAPDFPAMESISPLVGPEAGGTDITIIGTNLTDTRDVALVEVGGKPCDVVNVTVPQLNGEPDLVSPSPTYVVCKTRDHSAGPVDLKVTNPDSGIVDVPKQFTYLAAPTITSIAPLRIYSGQGARLTINGSNFDMVSAAPGNTVKLQPQAPFTPSTPIDCKIHNMSDTQIECDVPAMLATTYTASVVTAGGTAVSSGASGILTVQNAPGVSSLSPNSGVLAGTNTITVNGNNFTSDGTTSVTIGGKPCTNLSVASITQLSCTVPAGDGPAPVTVDVRVTVAFAAAGGGNVTSANTTLDNYTYLSGPAIDPGPGGNGDVSVDVPSNPNVPVDMRESRPPVVDLAGNYYGQTAIITINGSGFDTITNSTAVTVGGQLCTGLTVTTTTLTCNPPAQTAVGNYPIVVSTNAGSYPTGSQTINLYYLDKPTITAVSPNPVLVSTETTITIDGTNFDSISSDVAANKVEIGAGECTIVSIISSNQLTCKTPGNIVAGNPSQALRITTLAGTYLADGTNSNSASNGGDGNTPREQVEVTFQAEPAISAISPASGPVAGGTLVTVTASDICFNNASIIDGATVIKGANAISVFGPVVTPASVICDSSTGPSGGTFTIVTPDVTSDGAGPADITVSTTVGDSSPTPADGFSYMNTPSITSFSPLVTDVFGKALYTDSTNATLTIQGSNFDDISANLIYINDVPCPSTGTDTSSQLQCTIPASTIPAGGAGTNLEVKVITHGDTVSKGGTDGFTYLAAPTISGVTPAPVPSSAATTIYLDGANFDNITGDRSTTTSTSVKIGSGTCSNVTVTSTSTLSCTTPDDITTGGKQSISIKTLAGEYEADGNSGHTDVEVVFQDAPAVSAISPVSGTVAGGTQVTVTASNICLNNASIIDDVTVVIQWSTVTMSVFDSVVTPASVSCAISTGPSGGTFTILTPDVSSHGNVVADILVSTTVGDSTDTVADDFAYMNLPGISSISPTAAALTGKAKYSDAAAGVLTISGYDFDNIAANLIYINNVPCPSTGTDTTDQLQCTIPAGTGTDLEVKVVTHGDTVTRGGTGSADGFSYLAAPTVTSITPVRGQANVSREVTIAGSNFDNITGNRETTTSTTVKIGSGDCVNVKVSNAGSLTCYTPTMAAGGPLDITVTTLGGTNTLPGGSGGFTFQDAPNNIAVSPTAGNMAGGYQISIYGSNLSSFDPAAPSLDTVTIGGVPCTSASYQSSTDTIDCTVPAMPNGEALGARDVAINTLAGNHSLTGGFTYFGDPTLATISRTAGPIGGYTRLSITGTNFDNYNDPTSTKFFFGSDEYAMVTTVPVAGQCRVISDTLVNCLTLPKPADTTVIVTSSTGGVLATNTFSYTYLHTPGFLQVSPRFGPISGGTSITIKGETGLRQGDTIANADVEVGGIPCTVTQVEWISANDTTITCTTGVSTTSGWADVVSRTDGGQHPETETFNYLAEPTINSTTISSPNHGVVNTQVTITGTNFDPDFRTPVTQGGSGTSIFKFDGEEAYCTVSSTTMAVCTAPARSGGATYIDGTPSPVDITLLTGFHAGPSPTPARAAAAFDYMPRPTVSSINPSTGPQTAAGKTFTIFGTGFDQTYGSTEATVGGKTCVITGIASNGKSMGCELGAGELDFTTGVKAVVVTTAGGSDSQDLYTVQAVPTVSSLSKRFGAIGSTTANVVITGSGFVSGDTTVAFNTPSATSATCTFDSTTQLTCTAPVVGVTTGTALITAEVKVTTAGGTSDNTGNNNAKFDYVPVPTISTVLNGTQGSASLGQPYGPANTEHTIKITGNNFKTSANTNRANVISSVKVYSGTDSTICQASSLEVDTAGLEIKCYAPSLSAGVKSVQIVSSTGQTSAVNTVYEYIDLPTVTAVSPNSGPRAGGTAKNIILSGANFVGVTDVLFAGTSVGASNFTVNTDNPVTISVQAPAVSGTVTVFPHTVNVQVVAVGGTSTVQTGTADNYTYHAVPTVTSVAKNYGAIGATTANIVVKGTGFVTGTGATTVNFGTPTASCTVTSTTELSCTAPSQGGSADTTTLTRYVTVTTTGGTSSDTNNAAKFDYMARPLVSAVENNTTGHIGKIYGPSTAHSVKITGTNFRSATSGTNLITGVTLGGQPCTSISIASATSLTCTTTDGLATSPALKNIVVTSTTGQGSTTSGDGKYTIYGLPVINSITNPSGPFTSPPAVTIAGSNFRDVTAVTFGTAGNCSNVVVAGNYASLTCTPPNYSTAGKVDVRITAVGGTSTVQTGTNDDYTYVAKPALKTDGTGISPSPTTKDSKTVTLEGTGFLTATGATTVQVQGTTGNISAAVSSTTRLTFTMPAKNPTSATIYTVTVTTIGGVSNALDYEVLPAPTVSSVSPNTGPEAGATTVTVSGTNFCRAGGGSTSAINNIKVGTATGTIATGTISCSSSTNTIQFTTPAKPSTGDTYDITVTTAGGTSATSANSKFTYVGPPVVTAVKRIVGNAAPAATDKYVKTSDTMYVYADFLCENSSTPITLTGVTITAVADPTDTKPATSFVASPTCTTGTSGYATVVLPTMTTNMTAQYDITLTNTKGTSNSVAADRVIYPPAPTITDFDNASFDEYVLGTISTTDIILTGTSFKTAATGINLVKSITVVNADGADNAANITGYTVSSTAATSITKVTIPVTVPARDAGSRVIQVETYGGTGSFTFYALGTTTISSPTSSDPAYLWSSGAVNANIVSEDSFNVSGTNLVSKFTTIKIQNVDAKADSCNYTTSWTTITGCQINRLNSATNGNSDAKYTLKAVNTLAGTAERTSSIWIDQIAPTLYNFAQTSPVFACSNLVTRPNSTASTYHTAFVKDTRNNTIYRVRKLLDGNCWMIDNLAIFGQLLTSVTSDVGSDWTLPGLTNRGGDNMRDEPETRAGVGGALVYHQQNRGLLYNGRAAHAGFNSPSVIDYSVCPAGWRLPAQAEYPALGAAYNNVFADIWAQATGDFSTTFPGYYSGKGVYTGAGAIGRYIDNRAYLYGWTIRPEGTAAAFGGGNQGQASSVRCVKR